MNRLCKALLSFSVVLLVQAAFTAPALASTEHSFNYTITAEGTQTVTTMPEQSFTWQVTATGTEHWTTSGTLQTMNVEASGEDYGADRVISFYWTAPAGTVITGWSRSNVVEENHACQVDSYEYDTGIFTYSNGTYYFRVWVYTGGTYHSGSWGMPGYYDTDGYYSATYSITGYV
ncbi:hypothetical protein ACFLYQ_06745, partial [Chloroflexota bacterium]